MRTQELKEILENVWTGSVREEYGRGTLVSERALQAFLWAALRTKLGCNNEMKVLVEPSAGVADSTGKKWEAPRYRPDLVIVEERQEPQRGLIRLLMEIKHSPHCRSKGDDIEKFAKMIKRGPELMTSLIVPSTGKDDQNASYRMSDETLMVFAVIARASCIRTDRDLLQAEHFQTNPKVLSRTLLLSGSIKPEHDPKFGVSTLACGSDWDL